MNKIFLDSNILIYLYTDDEIDKIDKIKALLTKYENIYISTQVLFEFSNTMHKKFKRNYDDIQTALQEFHRAFNVALIRYDTIVQALHITTKYKYSFPDSLIIATALEYNCDIIFSEDMHNDHIIEDRLQMKTPFK